MKIRKVRSPILQTADENTRLQAFEKHFEQYWAPIYRLLRRMLGDPAEAEDLALETFYRLYQRQPDADPEFNTGGWLYRVATNLGLHSIRGFQRRERYELKAGKAIIEEAPEDRPAEILAGEEQRYVARRALAEMDPRRSELLVMRYSGMAYKEIAAALNLSPSSIGPLLVRAERVFEKRYRSLAQEEL
ncbi:MAG: sigma-70 family RNA polymerase sigma factor [Anaerolineales bacterium]